MDELRLKNTLLASSSYEAECFELQRWDALEVYSMTGKRLPNTGTCGPDTEWFWDLSMLDGLLLASNDQRVRLWIGLR